MMNEWMNEYLEYGGGKSGIRKQELLDIEHFKF